MRNDVRIYCKNTNSFHLFPIGSSLLDIYKQLKITLPYTVIGARVNNKTEGLKFRVYNAKNIEFIDISRSTGMRCYVRSLSFILYKAIDDLYPLSDLRIEHPISKGYYCAVNIGKKITQEDIDKIKARMHEIVDADIPFKRREAQSEEVVALFRSRRMEDKATLIESVGSVYSHYYLLDDKIDYYYGALAPSSGYIKLFDLRIYNGGMLLQVPSRKKPSIIEDYCEQPKLLEVFSDNLRFNKILGLQNVGELNMAIQQNVVTDLIKLTEALHEKQISRIADSIYNRGGVKVILISGPSSSGKTTFSKRLSVQLMTNLIRPVAISLDDYFINREETPLDEEGKHDFESLYALDLEQFNKDLTSLLNGEEVDLPTFNFETGLREYNGHKLKLEENQVLLLEGIHALNPELTKYIDEGVKFRIYVSALTTISLDNHNWIPTADNRLLRRIIRDSKYRKYSARDTIARWESVRRGEEKWIFPYQENADAMFNSSLLFELAVIKNHADPLLMEVPQNCDEYAEAFRLQKFLSYFKPVYEMEIPPTSLLREFLGGSSFRY